MAPAASLEGSSVGTATISALVPSADGCAGMTRAMPLSDETARSAELASFAGATICIVPGAPSPKAAWISS